MDLVLFCTAFIIQFVGHRIGDYMLQTDHQAQSKAKSDWARFKHCFFYSLTIGLMMAIAFKWQVIFIVFGITFLEHFYIDSRKPVIWYKSALERMVGNREFAVDKMPFFLLIEIDQTIHYTRCFIISILIGYGIL